jgi:hypothetical protein
VTLQEFDPYMVERIEVGKAVLINRRRQQGILSSNARWPGDGKQHFNRVRLEIVASPSFNSGWTNL